MYIFYIGLILLMFGIIGILQIIYPEQTYMFARKWMYRGNHELSDIAKLLIKGKGLILVGFSIYGFYLIITNNY